MTTITTTSSKTVYSSNKEQHEQSLQSGEEQEKIYDSSINEEETTDHAKEPGGIYWLTMSEYSWCESGRHGQCVWESWYTTSFSNKKADCFAGENERKIY